MRVGVRDGGRCGACSSRLMCWSRFGRSMVTKPGYMSKAPHDEDGEPERVPEGLGAVRRRTAVFARVVRRGPRDTSMTPQAAATVQMILAERASLGPGSAMLMARLADIILIHALRTRTCAAEENHGGLCALADPSIGAALRLIHARPAE